MRIAENKYYVYKADGSEIVDLTNGVTSISCDRGDVTSMGDGYTDSPVAVVDISLENNNQRLYSPHFKQNKVKYDVSKTITGDGGSSYTSPILNTISVSTPNTNYGVSFIRGKIEVNPKLPIGQSLEVWISYIDIDEKNPINFLYDYNYKKSLEDLYNLTLEEIYNQGLDDLYFDVNATYSPLIQEMNTFVWEQTIKDVSYTYDEVLGNGTNQIILNKKLDDVFLLTVATLLSKEGIYTLPLESLYSLTLEQIYNMQMLKETLQTGETAIIESFTTTDTTTTITFNRVIEENEKIFLTGKIYTIVENEIKFTGRITNSITSDIRTCKFQAKDLNYDLQIKKLEQSDLRNYYTALDDEDNYYTLEEALSDISVNNNSFSSSYNDLTELFSVGDSIYLYDTENYTKVTVSVVTTNNLIFSDEVISSGTFSVYKKYSPSLQLEKFIQNCLDDTNSGFELFVKDQSNYAVIPNTADMQYTNVWQFLQDKVVTRGMCLHFIYTKDTETYYNVDGTTKQGTNSFELVLQEIPITATGTPKYTIYEEDLLDDSQFESTGVKLVNSYSITYTDAYSEVSTEIVDDFVLSAQPVTVLTERNYINTDELLNVGDTVRINNEYRIVKEADRIVKEAVSSSVYKLSLHCSEAGEFNLYTIGTYSSKYGLRQATYELDSTSEINTREEAIEFGNLLLPQFIDIYATYSFKVYSRYFPNIKAFDLVRIYSPRYNLFNQDLYVQAVSEDDKFITFVVSEIMHLGKWKYYNMKVETGQNTLTTTNTINTKDVFKAPTNLKALDPAIDDLNNYVVYSRVSWDKIVVKNVTSWELQYSTSSTFDTYETLYLTTNTTKLILNEQKMYYIRVRGIGKEQVKGKWANTTVDASKYLIENPIQNRTWCIRLFPGNDEVEYFSQFDKLGYTTETLNNAIDSIEIVPNSDKGIKSVNYVLWNSNTTSKTGLNIGILTRLGKTTGDYTGKNLYFNSVLNGWYKTVGYNDGSSTTISGIIVTEWQNIKSNDSNVIFQCFDCIFGLSMYYDTDSIRTVENLTFVCDKNNYSTVTSGVNLIYGNASGIPYNEALTIYKKINVKFLNWGSTVTQGFLGANRLEECKVTGAYRGFVLCEGVTSCVVDTAIVGFDRCMLMYKNLATNCTTKYDTCYSSLSANATYLIATTGSDNVNGGFNI